TRDNYRRSTTSSILCDEDGTLEDLLPAQLREARLLHLDYTAQFFSCSQEEWLRWVTSGRAGLNTFIPLGQKGARIWRVEQEAQKRGLKRNLSYPYVTSHYIIEDWDFEEIYWGHWEQLAADDEYVWMKVVERILRQRAEYWNRAKNAQLFQVA